MRRPITESHELSEGSLLSSSCQYYHRVSSTTQPVLALRNYGKSCISSKYCRLSSLLRRQAAGGGRENHSGEYYHRAPVTIIIEDYHRAFTNYFRHFPLSSRNYHRGLSSTYELFTLSPRYYHRGLSSTYELITLSPRYYHRALSSTYELFTLSSTVSPRTIIDAYEFLCEKLQYRVQMG